MPFNLDPLIEIILLEIPYISFVKFTKIKIKFKDDNNSLLFFIVC